MRQMNNWETKRKLKYKKQENIREKTNKKRTRKTIIKKDNKGKEKKENNKVKQHQKLEKEQ
uniref:Uncharacterized protein n=1 Tax=Romanomermis culicivorax TaxID=13658 RepID=A0A915LA81_ROMCU